MAVAATSTISERENMMMGWEKERRKIEAIWRDPYIEWCHARRGPKSENGKTRAKKGQSDARALAGYLCATQNSLIWHVRLSFCDIWQRLFDRNVAMNGAKPRVLQFSCRLRRNRHIDSAQCPLTCSGLPLELPKTTPAWFCFFSLLCIITAWPFFFHKGGKVILKK